MAKLYEIEKAGSTIEIPEAQLDQYIQQGFQVKREVGPGATPAQPGSPSTGLFGEQPPVSDIEKRRANIASAQAPGTVVDYDPEKKQFSIGGVLANEGVATSAAPDMDANAQLRQEEDRIRQREAERLKIMQGEISGQFEEAIGRTRETGEKQISGTQAQLGISRGLGFSSSRAQFISSQQQELQRSITELEKAKASALANADLQAADREEGRIQQLREMDFNMRQQSFENSMAMLTSNQRQQEFDTKQQAQQEQQQWNMLEQIGRIGGTPPLQLQQLFDAKYGQGFTSSFLDFQKSAAQAQDIQQQVESATKLNNLLNTVPEGVEIPIGENVYSGQKVGDYSIRHELDNQGTLTSITFDEKGNPVNIQQIPGVGKRTVKAGGAGGSAGGGEITPENIEQLSPIARAIYENPALLGNYTRTKRGVILDELANAGADLSAFAQEKLNASQREQVDGFDAMLREATNAVEVLKIGLNVGPLASRAGQAKAAIGFGAKFTQYRSSIDNMSSQLLKLRSGAAVTPQEFQRIAGFIPLLTDDEKTAERKIDRFFEEMTVAQRNYVKRATETTQEIIESVQARPETKVINGQTYIRVNNGWQRQ